ncbi:MAG: lamin tail domain-containing protein, partial [Muribaculaceae bacterium]|nr:lamin tail domain-containing protein [Muribaculaceae bacterium]
MMKYRQLILVGLLAVGASTRAQVVINEMMQSNIDCIMDDLNEFPDSWVELYNSGTEAVNLGDYKLGVKDKASKAWQLPSQTLGAG